MHLILGLVIGLLGAYKYSVVGALLGALLGVVMMPPLLRSVPYTAYLSLCVFQVVSPTPQTDCVNKWGR